jgi:hypothetical protein
VASISHNNIRDYGLVAFLRVKGYDCTPDTVNRSYSVNLNPEEFREVIKPYFMVIKPILDQIRKTKKELSTVSQTPKS